VILSKSKRRIFFRNFLNPLTAALLFGMTCRVSVAADWTAINSGVTNLDIRVLAIDPINNGIVYAGGPSGLFKTVDGGANWNMTGVRIIKPGFPPSPLAGSDIVDRLIVDSINPNTLYAATLFYLACASADRRLLKSTDGGATWTDSVSPNINGCDTINSLVLAPSDPGTLYLTDFDGLGDTWSPLVRTTDGAATWTYLGYPLLNVLAVDPLDSHTVYAGTFDFEPLYGTKLPNGVLKSSDGGATWQRTGLINTGISAITMDPKNPNTIYTATGHVYGRTQDFHGVFKSIDAGASWAAINNGLSQLIGTPSTVSNLIVDPEDSNIVYMAMSDGGILRTVDGGATWTPFNDGLQDLHIRSLALAPGKPNTLYAGTASGVFKITDDVPVLSLETPRLCIGAPWTASLSKAPINRSANLLGVSNSQPWEVREWDTTDGAGHFSRSGTFAAGTEGRHMLRIEVAGLLSNSISFVVSNCDTP
jgi:photosystem II stability/assembly factor-like uncharacterized protein